MTKDAQRPSAAMEGKGAYNRHSLIPSVGGALAWPHLQRAIAETPLGPSGSPIVVADYGSSQGLNSLAPIRLAVEAIRARAGVDRPIFVYHNDQPSNDFNSLFEVLDTSPDCYCRGDKNVFPCAIGRSFYESVLPADSVHVGLELLCGDVDQPHPGAHPWPFHLRPDHRRGSRRTWERQGVQDWETFLSLRGRELKPGGCLVISTPGADDSGGSVFDRIMDHANTRA